MTTHHENLDDQNTSRRLYNPYQEHNLRYHHFNLPKSPEYLFTEDSNVQRRSLTDNITFLTGISYLSGSVIGAGSGLYKGVKAFEIGDTKKIKVSRILSTSGEVGRKYGNQVGVTGFFFSVIDGSMCKYRDKDDVINSLVAGLATGAIYKIPTGWKAMAIGGAIGGVVSGLYGTGKHVFRRYVHI